MPVVSCDPLSTDAYRSLVMRKIMTPDTVNFSGKVHGGHLLCFLDQVAYACAAQYAGKQVVTLSLDHVLFKQPVQVSDLLTCFANVNYVGNTSMEIGIRTEAMDVMTREKRHVLTCYFTMVAVDDNMKPTPVDAFTPNTAEEKRHWDEGLQRKQNRQKK